tara:strand:- start:8533 stop:8718 length:186 start_codon:yes stop_codon:yes gene_type:complete
MNNIKIGYKKILIYALVFIVLQVIGRLIFGFEDWETKTMSNFVGYVVGLFAMEYYLFRTGR